MSKKILKFAKVRDVKSPSYGSDYSAGIDFYIPNDWINQPIELLPNEDILIPSGIQVDMMEYLKQYALIAHDKSGVSTNKKLKVAAKVIDADYQGEIGLHVYNYSNKPVTLESGMKLVQFLCIPIEYVQLQEEDINNLYSNTTGRGANGFGSTGDK